MTIGEKRNKVLSFWGSKKQFTWKISFDYHKI